MWGTDRAGLGESNSGTVRSRQGSVMVQVNQRCEVCGRAVSRTGHAKAYVHENQFHQRFNHAPVVRAARPRMLTGTADHVINLRDDVRRPQRATA